MGKKCEIVDMNIYVNIRFILTFRYDVVCVCMRVVCWKWSIFSSYFYKNEQWIGLRDWKKTVEIKRIKERKDDTVFAMRMIAHLAKNVIYLCDISIVEVLNLLKEKKKSQRFKNMICFISNMNEILWCEIFCHCHFKFNYTIFLLHYYINHWIPLFFIIHISFSIFYFK